MRASGGIEARARRAPTWSRRERRSYNEEGPLSRAVFLLDLAFLVDHVLPDDGIVLLDLHLVRRVLLVLVGRVEVTGVGGGDQADLVALGGHGSILLRSSRRGHAARPGPSRCRSCRWCAGPARKPSA